MEPPASKQAYEPRHSRSEDRLEASSTSSPESTVDSPRRVSTTGLEPVSERKERQAKRINCDSSLNEPPVQHRSSALGPDIIDLQTVLSTATYTTPNLLPGRSMVRLSTTRRDQTTQKIWVLQRAS